MTAPENGFETVNGTINPLGYTKRQRTECERLELPLYGLKQIAHAMGISVDRLKQYTAAGSMDWLGHTETGRYWTLTGSAEYCGRHMLPSVVPALKALAAQTRGKAGAAACERDEEGRFTAVSAPGLPPRTE